MNLQVHRHHRYMYSLRVIPNHDAEGCGLGYLERFCCATGTLGRGEPGKMRPGRGDALLKPRPSRTSVPTPPRRHSQCEGACFISAVSSVYFYV